MNKIIQIIACVCGSFFSYTLFSGHKPLTAIPKIITIVARAAQKRSAREAYEIAYGKVYFCYGYNRDTGMQTMLPYDVISRLHTYQRKISSKPMDPDVPEGLYAGDCLAKQTYYSQLPLKYQEDGFKTQVHLMMAASMIPYTAILYAQVYKEKIDANYSVDVAHAKAADAVTHHYIQGAQAYDMGLSQHISRESFTSGRG